MDVLTVYRDIEKDGKIKTIPKSIQVATLIEDMQFRQWMNYQIKREDNWPDWLKEYGQLDEDQQREKSSLWSPLEEAEYYLHIGGVVECFSNTTLEDILLLPLMQNGKGDTASLEVLGRKIFKALNEYVPDDTRKTFSHNGFDYVIPEDDVIKIGQYEQITRAAKVKAGSIIEALQRAHIYGGKDASGAYVLRDRRYYTDLAMVACIARRKLKNGQLEKIPWGLDSFNSWVDKRMEELSTLGANVALDLSFFLLTSVRNSLNTVTSNMHSKILTERKMQRQLRRSWRGRPNLKRKVKRGDGMQPS